MGYIEAINLEDVQDTRKIANSRTFNRFNSYINTNDYSKNSIDRSEPNNFKYYTLDFFNGTNIYQPGINIISEFTKKIYRLKLEDRDTLIFDFEFVSRQRKVLDDYTNNEEYNDLVDNSYKTVLSGTFLITGLSLRRRKEIDMEIHSVIYNDLSSNIDNSKIFSNFSEDSTSLKLGFSKDEDYLYIFPQELKLNIFNIVSKKIPSPVVNSVPFLIDDPDNKTYFDAILVIKDLNYKKFDQEIEEIIFDNSQSILEKTYNNENKLSLFVGNCGEALISLNNVGLKSTKILFDQSPDSYIFKIN